MAASHPLETPVDTLGTYGVLIIGQFQSCDWQFEDGRILLHMYAAVCCINVR